MKRSSVVFVVLLITLALFTLPMAAQTETRALARPRTFKPVAPAGCNCADGHWWDANRKSCVTGACKVPGMPDGDKGGGYFAWQGELFVNTPCTPCGNLNLTATTGQPGWQLVSGPGISAPQAPVVMPAYPGWGTVPGASWVSVNGSGGSGAGGFYVYEYQFCLCASAKGQRLDLTFLADNGAVISLNGKQIHATTGNGNFKNPPKTVSYTGVPSDWVIPGTNTLRIVVENESNVTGLAASLVIRADNGACPK
jgi:hypothetical protein